LGQKQTSRHVRVMSVIPLKADIHHGGLHVCLVPEADMTASGWRSDWARHLYCNLILCYLSLEGSQAA
jgi:hypothetical protein